MPFHLDASPYLVLGGVLIALLIARRIPVLRTLVSLASWVVAIGLVIVLLQQREALSPYVGRVAALLDLEEQKVVGGEVRIRMAPDGHFWARVRLGGAERRMLIDSGATITAISTRTADAAGIEPSAAAIPVLLNTANGTIRAESARVPELWLGAIVARDLPVVVSPAFGEVNVLGMNFLSRLQSWRVEGRTLVLVPHHPQPVDA